MWPHGEQQADTCDRRPLSRLTDMLCQCDMANALPVYFVARADDPNYLRDLHMAEADGLLLSDAKEQLLGVVAEAKWNVAMRVRQ